MSDKITVTTKEQAWAEADKIFPTDYDKDETASANAGYAIYRHQTLNPLSRICDLGNRLEVLTGKHGENVTNIWIEPEIITSMGTNMAQSDYVKLSGRSAWRNCTNAKSFLQARLKSKFLSNSRGLLRRAAHKWAKK